MQPAFPCQSRLNFEQGKGLINCLHQLLPNLTSGQGHASLTLAVCGGEAAVNEAVGTLANFAFL